MIVNFVVGLTFGVVTELEQFFRDPAQICLDLTKPGNIYRMAMVLVIFVLAMNWRVANEKNANL